MANINDPKLIEEFNSLDRTVNLYPSTQDKKIESIDELKQFVETECTFWQPFDIDNFSKFNDAKNNLEAAIQSHVDISNSKDRLKNCFNILRKTNPKIIYSCTEEAKFLKSMAAKFPCPNGHHLSEGYLGAKTFLFNNDLNKIGGNKDFFSGVMDAYLFRDIQKSIKGYLKEDEKSLAEIQSKFSLLSDEFERRNSKFDIEIKSCVDKRENLIKQSGNSFAEQKDKLNADYEAKLKEWTDKITALEDKYRFKLTLEEPVKSWDEYKKDYYERGMFFVKASSFAAFVMTGIRAFK